MIKFENNSNKTLDDFILSWVVLVEGLIGIITIGLYRPPFTEKYLKYMLFKKIKEQKK